MAKVIEGLLLLLAAAAGVYWMLPALAKGLLRRRLLARVRRSGCACLTFDDGPSPEATPQILEELARAGVRATFFMIGERARRHPALAAEVAARGHEIGEHGYAHQNAWRCGPWTAARDLWRGHAALAALGPAGLRPPYGKLNLVTLLYAGLKRRRLIFWDVDPRDYRDAPAAQVARHVRERLGGGRIILLHDGRMRPGGEASNTVAALRAILGDAAAAGIPLVTVGEALRRGGGTNGSPD